MKMLNVFQRVESIQEMRTGFSLFLIIINSGLKNCLHCLFRVHYAKAVWGTRKNVHANYEISLISKIFERYFWNFYMTALMKHLL